MKKFRSLSTGIVYIALCSSPLNSQSNDQPEEYSEAYQDSNRSAHWSAYVPLAAIVASAAFFGWADQKTVSGSSSRSKLYSGHSGHYSPCREGSGSSNCTCY